MHECGDDGDEDPLGCHRRDLSLDSLLCLRRCSDGRTAYEMLSGEYGGDEPLPAVLSFAHVAGKGVGVIATRPVAKGERLVAEAPLLEWASEPASSTGECDWAPLAAAVARLGHARRLLPGAPPQRRRRQLPGRAPAQPPLHLVQPRL